MALDQGTSEADAKELGWIARQAAIAAMERNNLHNDWMAS
jgi:hypothetical protein